MNTKWYQVFVEKLYHSIDDTLLLIDEHSLLETTEIQSYLNQEQIVVHRFNGELMLRSFLRTSDKKRRLVYLASEDKLKQIPFDLRKTFPIIHWSLSSLFTNWDAKALSYIPYSWIPLLYPLSQQSWLQGRKLCTMDALDLAIRFMFQLPLHEQLNPTKQLYSCLRMLEEFSEFPHWFNDWLTHHSSITREPLPIELNKEQFYSWLQDIWERCCSDLPEKNDQVFDFSDSLLNVSMQKLFDTGKLELFQAIPLSKDLKTYLEGNPWIAMGLNIEKKQNYQDIINKFYQDLLVEIANNSTDWIKIAQLKSKIDFYSTYFDLYPVTQEKDIETLDKAFILWIDEEYSNLWFRSFRDQPYVIHQVLPHIKELKASKNVLICFDGMSFEEWWLIERYLREHYINRFQVKGCFAWIPTLTSISRKALFAGLSNDAEQSNEEKLFKDFWTDKNHLMSDIKLFKHQKLSWTEDYLYFNQIGIIFNTVDDLAHSDQYTGTTKKTLLSNLYENLCQSNFYELIKHFLAHQYRIFITSDHGTIKAKGNKIEESKYLVENKSKRALIYPNQVLAENKLSHHNESKLWMFKNEKTLGEKVALLPRNREMFANETTSLITHGACTLEEVIVPFIEVILT